jgi:hypothetical protein
MLMFSALQLKTQTVRLDFAKIDQAVSACKKHSSLAEINSL